MNSVWCGARALGPFALLLKETSIQFNNTSVSAILTSALHLPSFKKTKLQSLAIRSLLKIKKMTSGSCRPKTNLGKFGHMVPAVFILQMRR